ncbi:hypothetical protein PDESU_05635 [Pontiella desulfatans]|uniref:Uncharacterized protein n=1 Tax=Pontiella desulfatans TaxID=2750659 RepID=A0A6C2UCA0_PONDE|nr:hypothetical protein [Pontiella desulfatans]VGO17041.1 hypothetical protein PDESU_05635 [Pontiella desulfatans]
MKVATLIATALICGNASATILTFDAGLTDGAAMPQNSGDNVTNTTMGAYTYGENGEGFTPT